MISGRMWAPGPPDWLRRETLADGAWEVMVEPLLDAGARVGLSGDRLWAIPAAGGDRGGLKDRLEASGLSGVQVERVDPTLEDVFLALAAE